MKRTTFSILATVSSTLVTGSASALIEYDQNVTNEIIFGSGNLNGSFTTDRNNGVELGLRGKLRHNGSGSPENTFNSNGDGTYTFQPIVAPTQSSPTAEWSFEWSINSDYDGTSGYNLNDLTYELGMTSTSGASITTFDPINGVNAGLAPTRIQWDHAIGTNATVNGDGTFISNGADDAAGYATLIDTNNIAQNSWKPHWFTGTSGFDPTDEAVYTFTLSAYDGTTLVASTSAAVVTPEPSSLALLGLGGLIAMRRRRSN